MTWPASIRVVVSEWSKVVFTIQAWTPDANRPATPGEAGGFYVITDSLPFTGYLKPTSLCQDHHPRAANEKIVADLATHLGITVPPVQLFRRENCPNEQEPRACVSLVLFHEIWRWSELAGIQSQQTNNLINHLLSQCSGVIAFDTFVGNTDRVNEGNAVFGTNGTDDESAMMFIDYANSLNHNNNWEAGKWNNLDYRGAFDRMKQSVNLEILWSAIEQIESLSDTTIEGIVSRIPDDYMSPAHKSVVIEGLVGRRSLIRQIVAGQFAI